MGSLGAMVTIDAGTLECACPYHGPQPGAEYAAHLAPCGCLWSFDVHQVLRAHRADDRQSKTVKSQQDVSVTVLNSHNT